MYCFSFSLLLSPLFRVFISSIIMVLIKAVLNLRHEIIIKNNIVTVVIIPNVTVHVNLIQLNVVIEDCFMSVLFNRLLLAVCIDKSCSK